MKALKSVIAILLVTLSIGCQETYQSQGDRVDLSAQEKLYYGVKINRVLCGFGEVELQPIEREGKAFLRIDRKTFVMVSALGSKFNSEVNSVSYVDSASGRFAYQKHHIKQGPMDFTVEASVENDTVTINSTLSQKPSKIAIDAGVILGNDQFFPFLIHDFSDSSVCDKTYRVFEPKDQEIQRTTFHRLGEETLDLAGSKFDAIVLEEMNQKTGVKMKWWLDKHNGHMLKLITSRSEIFLADAGVKDKIRLSSMDDLIMLRSNVSLADVQAISYMKVRARLEPSGLRISPRSLNVPGQKFTGTVEENLVEGVFEIEHQRYDGANAPPVPPNFSRVDSLQEFLRPTDLLESDDSVLVHKARQLTAGSMNAWEAAVRLSRWVADSIGYAIPGGLTARHTYEIRKGECGAHSILLAAFCRAIGIPARMVWGCMYVPNLGGAFGQHGWTEVYMGQAGWIPVDATAKEPDYVDSGHLRLGHFQSLSIALNPKEMEVLEYRILADSAGMSPDREQEYRTYIGTYHGKHTLHVRVQNGRLTVDIPGKVMLALNDPDETGFWYAKMSSNVFFEFSKDARGKVTEIILHEMIPLPRKADADADDLENVPQNLTPYLGVYEFPHANGDFRVFCRDASLVIHDPLRKRDVRLQPPDSRGRWKDEFNKNEILFEKDETGRVKTMRIDSINRFRKDANTEPSLRM